MTAPPNTPARNFPAPWRVVDATQSFKIVDATGQALAYVHYDDPNGLTWDEARRIAANIAKLPQLAG
jgi:hypothetical protein